MGAMVPPSRKSCYNFRVVSIDRVCLLYTSDAINNALDSFWEQEHGSNGSTKSEELL